MKGRGLRVHRKRGRRRRCLARRWESLRRLGVLVRERREGMRVYGVLMRWLRGGGPRLHAITVGHEQQEQGALCRRVFVGREEVASLIPARVHSRHARRM